MSFQGDLKKVQERRDDITKPEAESRPERGAQGGYYYDDATGYETYSPEEDDEEEGGGGPPGDAGR
jgi:hypothetical protein